MDQQLERLLRRCTVKLNIPGKMGWGTGFFVAPGLIITCYHVVKNAENSSVHVCWQNQEDFAEAIVERSLSEFDLALLRFSSPVADLPCVYLDESFQADDHLYTYGYPDDFPQGAPVTAKCEGMTGDEPPLIKFKAGQVRPGLSGSPLLNQRTGKVCGIVKFTRDRSFDLGGGAVPTSEIFSQFPELKELQEAFHRQDNRWTKLLQPPPSQTRLSRQEYRNRQALLNKVNQFWVKGVLERSLHNQVLIELGLEERPDTLAQPWDMVLQTPGRDSKPLPEGTKVIELFDEIGEGRTLVILGEPGSGKTTTLLELTRDLVHRAEQDCALLIPVVFNLSSWAVKEQQIENWLVEELNSQYQVPKKIGQAFIEEDKLLLLLDGLDEVKTEYREQCITALNYFNQNHCSEIVVCSRIKDYEALSNHLNFQSAVYLRLLTLEQIRSYLNSLSSNITGLRALIERDTALQELAQSPLMVNVMILAYQEVAVEDLPKFNVVEKRQSQLFDDYIEKVFNRPNRSKNQTKYSKKHTKIWLSWLAKKMLQESKTIFLIERMQPIWFKKNINKIFYLLISLSIEVIIEVFLVGLGVWALFLFYMDAGLIKNAIKILSLVGIFWFFGHYIAGAEIIPSNYINRRENYKIKPTEKLSFSLEKLIRFWRSELKIAVYAIPLSLFIVSIFIYLVSQNILLIFLGTFVIISSLILVSLIEGTVEAEEIERKIIPNQGIKKSIINVLFLTIIVYPFTLILVILSQYVIWKVIWNVVLNNIYLIPPALVSSLFFSILMAMMESGRPVIQHLSLRIILWINGFIPWNYARFLDYATERILLQKVGGGYIFVHRMLMEHFAKMKLKN